MYSLYCNRLYGNKGTSSQLDSVFSMFPLLPSTAGPVFFWTKWKSKNSNFGYCLQSKPQWPAFHLAHTYSLLLLYKCNQSWSTTGRLWWSTYLPVVDSLVQVTSFFFFWFASYLILVSALMRFILEITLLQWHPVLVRLLCYGICRSTGFQVGIHPRWDACPL